MIISKDKALQIYEVAKDRKTVSRLNFEKKDVVNYIHTINKINSLPYNARMLNGELLSDFVVLEVMKDLIIPARVQLVTGDLYHDFLDEYYSKYEDNLEFYGMQDAQVLNAAKFTMMSKMLAGAVKNNSAATKAVSEIKVDVNLDSVKDRLMDYVLTEVEIDDEQTESVETIYISSDQACYLPIRLTIKKFKDSFYNNELDSDKFELHFDNIFDELMIKR